MNILIRADSSSEIGTGHIMRDLVLAKQYPRDNIVFATQCLNGNINHKIVEAKYKIKILRSNDIDELDSVIKELKIDMIVIDHYGIDYDFEKQLKSCNPKLKIFVLDDTYERHDCDILLNHNICADKLKYKDLIPSNCDLRCGSKHTLLRQEFILNQDRKTIFDDKAIRVLIVMGGADHSNININILKVLEMFSNLVISIVTTTANKNLQELQNYIKDKDNMNLYINTNTMAKFMYESDFVIVTPSVTINEVYYMNIPFIAIKTAENQNDMYEYLKKNDFLVLERFNFEEMKYNVETMINNLKDMKH